jgi:FtsH-binding integral membrane protein
VRAHLLYSVNGLKEELMAKARTKINTGVFDKRGRDTIGERAFFFVLAAAVIYGLGVTAYGAHYSHQIGFQPGIWGILLLGLAVPITGIVIAVKSDNPLLSFFGYNLVVIPFGLILGPVLDEYSPSVIMNAALITGGVTAVFGILGVSQPKWFEGLGSTLFICLCGLLVVRIAQLFIPALAGFGLIDWLSAGLFSMYIGYDMHRATSVPKTLDNAVDVAVDLYLDIINLFLSILRIAGSSSD